jgi:hypothetical protein
MFRLIFVFILMILCCNSVAGATSTSNEVQRIETDDTVVFFSGSKVSSDAMELVRDNGGNQFVQLTNPFIVLKREIYKGDVRTSRIVELSAPSSRVFSNNENLLQGMGAVTFPDLFRLRGNDLRTDSTGTQITVPNEITMQLIGEARPKYSSDDDLILKPQLDEGRFTCSGGTLRRNGVAMAGNRWSYTIRGQCFDVRIDIWCSGNTLEASATETFNNCRPL